MSRVCRPPLTESEDRAIVDFLRDQDRMGTAPGLVDLAHELYGNVLAYDRVSGIWFAYDGSRWAKGLRDDLPDDVAMQLARNVQRVAKASGDKYVLTQMRAFARSYHLRTFAHWAKAGSFDVPHSVWDANQWLLNVTNGTLDLSGDAPVLRPHAASDYITQKCDLPWDPEAPAPRWEQFITEVVNGYADLAPYLQRVLGYCLTGSVREQCFFYLYGSGCNGKSTFTEAVHATIGEYSRVGRIDSFTTDRHESTFQDLAVLAGSRFVYVTESERDKNLDEVVLKMLSGEKTFTARMLYENDAQYPIGFKLFFYGNSPPRFPVVDSAIRRRLQLVPFTASFLGAPDKSLPDKLRAEAVGILAWMVRGCMEWKRSGLNPPACVIAASEECLDEQDAVSDFLKHETTREPDAKVSLADLRGRYVSFCKAKDQSAKSAQKFAADLRGKGITVQLGHGNRTWVLGIQLNAQEVSA